MPICEECGLAVDKVASDGRFQGICPECEVELSKEALHYRKGFRYVFGETDID